MDADTLLARLLKMLKAGDQADMPTSGASKKSRRAADEARHLTLPADGTLPALSLTLEKDNCTTIRLRVQADGSLRLRVPRTLSDLEALAFVLRKGPWIQNARERIAAKNEIRNNPAIFIEQGEKLHLRLEDAGLPRIVISRQGSELLVRGGCLEESAVKAALHIYQRQRALALFPPLLKKLHQQACTLLGDNYPLPLLSIKDVTGRWGSCARKSRNGTSFYSITLSLRLVALPPRLAEYVILHELCHMRHMDHSWHFHQALEILCPRHRELEREIHENY